MPRAIFGNKLDKKIKQKAFNDSILLKEEEKEQINKQILKENLDHWVSESSKKMNMLFDYYSINKNSNDKWVLLSFELAKSYIKGFQLESNEIKRKPKTWDAYRSMLLYMDVEIKRSELEKSKKTNISDKAICKWLKNNKNIWKDKTSLYQRYCDSKKNEVGYEPSFLVRHFLLPDKKRIFDEDLYNRLKNIVKPNETLKNKSKY